jgi:hypothetical protein
LQSAVRFAARRPTGFFLVDIHRQTKVEPPPQTFVEMSSEELTALGKDLARSMATPPSEGHSVGPESPGSFDPLPDPEPELIPSSQDEESVSIENWREVRRRTGRLRVPPRGRPAGFQAQQVA